MGFSLIIKGASLLVSFILVPITLGYLDPFEYGVWLTLNSVLSWIFLFDIGLGNGLKNKLAEAIAKEDYQTARKYIATTFLLIFIIGIVIYCIFAICQSLLDWHKILNVPLDKIPRLQSIVTVVFAFVIGNFIFRTIGLIYVSKQYPAINDLIALIGNLMSLIIIFILSKTSSGSLQWVAYTFTGIPLVVYFITFPITFKSYPELKPRLTDFKLHDTQYWRPLITIGLKFFILQIAYVVTYLSSNIIISHLFGPSEVTPYNIAYKLFTIPIIGFSIILTPFWVAITDAVTQNHYDWIKGTVKRLLLLILIISAGIILLIYISPLIYKIWLGDEIEIPFSLSLWFGIYAIIYNLVNLFNYISNGFGKLKLQMIFSCLQALIFVPITYFLGEVFGINGIVIALIITVAINIFWGPIQTYKLINQCASGIWNK